LRLWKHITALQGYVIVNFKAYFRSFKITSYPPLYLNKLQNTANWILLRGWHFYKFFYIFKFL